ncbi:MAG: AAA family ATPase [Gemmatimonadales bacterium]
MIQIEVVTIREMRGIRELEVRPNRKSFVIAGPNGSGKSGIVDAIQFALTGEMSRLSGKGTGGLSVGRHGPHVDRRDDPSAAEVTLQFYVPALDCSAALTRNVKTPRMFRLEPDDPRIRGVVDELSEHPELTLSRREIIKYILVEAGQRSKEIQALLKLEEIGETRGVLKTVGNKLSIALRNSERDVANATDALRRHLDIKSLQPAEVLAAVNPRRHMLGLSELNELTAETAVNAGAAHSAPAGAFPRDTALRDIGALEEAWQALGGLVSGEAGTLAADLAMLESDTALLDAVTRRTFIESGLSFVVGPECPLCDLEWLDEGQLRAHLQEKVARAHAAEQIHSRVLANGAAISEAARHLVALLTPVQAVARTVARADLETEFGQWAANLAAFASDLGSIEAIARHRQRLEDGWPQAPHALPLQALRRTVESLPDQTATTAAQVFLALAQDRLSALGAARRDCQRAAAAVKGGNAMYKLYCDLADGYLTRLYAAVEAEFATFYRAVNTDDEGSFKARLAPAEGGLDLEVAFYDKGMFPPGAYHSEGHQDGMGVCLYLALMKQLFGARFRFAVLDDVVMSVDRSHRKQFCRLLKSFFPDTQFIITTHDPVWAKQMRTEGLVDSKGSIAFNSWSVQTGPIVEQLADVWERLEADIGKGDISAAAARLRRHMEYVAGELSDALGATPRYRGDFSYDLGDLLPPVIGRYGDLLRQAARAAGAWNNQVAQQQVASLKKARSTAVKKHGDEAWVINKAVHYNEWAHFTDDEFREVVDAFKGLLEVLRCARPGCESWLYVSPMRGTAEALRCRCGAINLNLRER